MTLCHLSVCTSVRDKLLHWQLRGHYLQQSDESWPKGILWEDLQNDMTLGDLDQGQGHSIYWKFGKYPLFDNISYIFHSKKKL